MNTTIIVIDGNIGSGKSELVKNLKKNKEIFDKEIIFLHEPVDEWATIKDNDGVSILELYYADQERWSFAFQMMAYISRLALLQKTCDENPNSIIVMERSMYTDKYVFAKMLYEQNKIHECEMDIYTRWFENFAGPYKPSYIIYVKTSPDICSERIKKRGRQGENVPIDFLIECDTYHENMMNNYEQKSIINIDGNRDCYSEGVLNNWLQIIKTKIESLY